MNTPEQNRKSYEIRIFPYLVNDDHFYKVVICDVEWINKKDERYGISARDIFVFQSLREAVEAMANFCAEGQYPEE